jgi:hypothetical protein
VVLQKTELFYSEGSLEVISDFDIMANINEISKQDLTLVALMSLIR